MWHHNRSEAPKCRQSVFFLSQNLVNFVLRFCSLSALCVNNPVGELAVHNKFVFDFHNSDYFRTPCFPYSFLLGTWIYLHMVVLAHFILHCQ